MIFKKWLVKLLQYCEDSLMTEDQLWEQNIIRENKTFITKKEICSFLNISTYEFDKKIYNKTFPKGRKRKGKEELFWIEEDLI